MFGANMNWCWQCATKAALLVMAYVVTLTFGWIAIIPLGITALIYLMPLPKGIDVHDNSR